MPFLQNLKTTLVGSVALTIIFGSTTPFALGQISRLGVFNGEKPVQKKEAYIGKPFGVGRIIIPIGELDRELLRTNGLTITESQGRIHYPVFSSGLVKKAIDVLAGESDSVLPRNLAVYFLFTGDQPFTVKINASTALTIPIEPTRSRPLQKNLLSRTWWREFNQMSRSRNQQSDYPPLIESYLTAMLAERLNLPRPFIERTADAILVKNEIQNILDLFLGAELRHLKLMRETMSGTKRLPETAAQPLPTDIFPLVPEILPDEKRPEIEEIVSRVPEECFYLRFGKWQNFVWLTRLAKEYGGDLGRLAILRGIEPYSVGRMEEQLCLEQDPLAETFGQTVISDFAVIGNDLYLTEGPAVGVLFQQRNSLLTSQLQSARAKILEKEKGQGAIEKTVEIAGRKVFFLSTADNRLRSFYAKEGEFHLITNCRSLVKRFFECGTDKSALNHSREFLETRISYPLESEDTVFVFMPSNFFRRMLSSKYQVENARRQQALVDIELLQLASTAARGEGWGELPAIDLIEKGFLPEDFGKRIDRSGPIAATDQVIDSLRGARGYFTPIPDITVDQITQAEAKHLSEQNKLVGEQWNDLVPLVATIKREKLDRKGLERLSFSANITSILGKQGKDFTAKLGPPTQFKHGTSRNDIVNLHVSVGEGLLLKSVPDYQFFAAIQNEPTAPITVKPSGFFTWLELLKGFPCYLGAWPKPGFLDTFTPQLARPDEEGFSYSRLLDLHRMQLGEYSILAFNKQRLKKIRPDLGATQSESFGQIHLDIGDLSTSELVPLINTLFYQRALQSTLGNIKLLNSMTQQLKVPPADARESIEKLLDGKLICSLEGDYQQAQFTNGRAYWTSDRLPPSNIDQLPVDYQSNLMAWFRGANLTVLVHDKQIMVSGSVKMQRQKTKPAASKKKGTGIPGFNLFGNGQKEPSDSKDKLNPNGKNKKR